jgi:cell cycle checkpoint protein
VAGTAYIFADIFDEYTYNSESPAAPQNSQTSEPEEEEANSAFEIPLNTLIECLNIFGTAGSSGAGTGAATGKYKKWKRAGDDSDQEGDEDNGQGRRSSNGGARGIEHYFGNASDKATGMRMSYAGSGFPLTLLMWVSSQHRDHRFILFFSAEDAAGPTTTCEITTYEAEPHLQLPFESDRMYVHSCSH